MAGGRCQRRKGCHGTGSPWLPGWQSGAVPSGWHQCEPCKHGTEVMHRCGWREGSGGKHQGVGNGVDMARRPAPDRVRKVPRQSLEVFEDALLPLPRIRGLQRILYVRVHRERFHLPVPDQNTMVRHRRGPCGWLDCNTKRAISPPKLPGLPPPPSPSNAVRWQYIPTR